LRTPIHILACAAILLTGSAAAAQTTQTYRYDANGRLTAAITAGTSSGSFSNYLLDDADNRVARNNYPTGYPAVSDRLSSGEFLLPGQQLTSADGRFALKVQQDGNLVLWFGSTQLRASDTATGKSLYLRLETSGVLNLMDAAGALLWATPAAGANATLTLQNDGNLVLKTSGGSLVWQTSTCCH
jgi:YD repeat-containing protein